MKTLKLKNQKVIQRERILIFIFNIFLFSSIYAQTDSLAKRHSDSLKISADTEKSISKADSISLDKKQIRKANQIYKLSPAVDIPIIAIGTTWSLYAFTKIYIKTPPTETEVLALNKNNVNAFDRNGIYPYSYKMDKQSYYPFYAAIALPFIVFSLDKKMRKNYARLMYLYWEAYSITGLCGTAATYFVNRYRPYEYTSETSMDKRTNSWALNSFYSGHSQVVAVSTFFCAKVLADYYPESKMKWVYYGAAAAATGYVSYLRLKSGEHFPTDLIVGSLAGALTGILVPQFHKRPLIKNTAISLTPYMNGAVYGVVFNYRPN